MKFKNMPKKTQKKIRKLKQQDKEKKEKLIRSYMRNMVSKV